VKKFIIMLSFYGVTNVQNRIHMIELMGGGRKIMGNEMVVYGNK